MKNKVYLKAWSMMGNGTVKLTYQDEQEVLIQNRDFDRAFGPIVSADKATVIRDYAIRN